MLLKIARTVKIRGRSTKRRKTDGNDGASGEWNVWGSLESEGIKFNLPPLDRRVGDSDIT